MKPLHGRNYEWSIILLFALAYGMTSFDRWLLPTLFPVAGPDLGIDIAGLSNITAAMSLVFGLCAVLAGIGSDRWGRRPIMIGSMAVFSVCSALTGLVSGLVALLVVRVILGVAEGAFVPPMYSATVEASHPKRRGLNTGLVISAFPFFGLGAGPIIATQLLNVVPSWHWVFFLSAVPGLVLLLLIVRRAKEAPNYVVAEAVHTSPEKVNLGSLLRAVRERNIFLAIVITVLALAAMFVLGGLIPTYLTSVAGVSVSVMGFIASAIGFGGFTGQILLAGLSDLWGRRPVLLLEIVGAALFFLLITRVGTSPAALFATLFGAAFFSFAVLSLVGGPIVAEAAPRGLLGAGNGLVVGGGEIIGSGLLAAVIGHIVQAAGLSIAPTLAAGVMILAAVFALALRETAPRRLQRAARNVATVESTTSAESNS